MYLLQMKYHLLMKIVIGGASGPVIKEYSMRLIANFYKGFIRKYLCTECGVHGTMHDIENPALKCPKCGHWTIKFLN